MKHPLPESFQRHGGITVAVAGAGGNGSQILSGLARMHCALRALGHDGLRVTLYDADLVSEANVGRQLFSPSDVGAFKADVLINRINCFFGFNWKAINANYSSVESFRYTLLIGCVDSAEARRTLSKGKWEYWLDLGNTDQKGQVVLGTRVKPKLVNRYEQEIKAKQAAGWRPSADENVAINKRLAAIKKRGAKSPFVFQPPRPRTVLEVFPELNQRVKEDDAPSCSLAEALERQDLFINQSVATFALQLLWQFIRQGGLNIHGYFINLETGRVTPLPIK